MDYEKERGVRGESILVLPQSNVGQLFIQKTQIVKYSTARMVYPVFSKHLFIRKHLFFSIPT